MAGFLYHLPGKGAGVGLPDFQAAGIDYAWPQGSACKREVRGPDGAMGVVVADEKHLDAPRVGYYPDAQQWQQVPGSDAWVGFYTEDRPGPDDLVLSETLDGHWVRLADGRDWLAPVARGLIEQNKELPWYNSLPTTTTIDAEGNWQSGDVVARYQPLWKVACAWWDAIHGAEIQEAGDKSRVVFDFAGVNDAALTVLQANYRLGKTEVAMIGLFDDQCVRSVLDAMVDWPTLVEFVKKNPLPPEDGSSTAGGPADETPDTARA